MSRLRMLTIACCAALSAAAPPRAAATPVGAGAFGPLASLESFEGLAPGANVALALGASLLEPGTAGAFAFASGVTLSAPVPNPGYGAAGPFVHDFALGADVQNAWGGARVVNDAGDVPFGSAYLGAFASAGTASVSFSFATAMLRVGASVTGVTAGTVRLDVYDAADALLESHVLGTVDLAGWGANFLGLEHAAGIRRAVFTGADFGLDGLAFEAAPIVVPEPATLPALALGLLGLLGIAMLGRRPLAARPRRRS
jgi:hypothetical protein